MPTGFVDLDNLLTGLHGGELVIVGARPSMGKTSFAMNIIGYAATMAGKTTAMFSLEMPKDQLAMRLLCADARVDMQAVLCAMKTGFRCLPRLARWLLPTFTLTIRPASRRRSCALAAAA